MAITVMICRLSMLGKNKESMVGLALVTVLVVMVKTLQLQRGPFRRRCDWR